MKGLKPLDSIVSTDRNDRMAIWQSVIG